MILKIIGRSMEKIQYLIYIAFWFLLLVHIQSLLMKILIAHY